MVLSILTRPVIDPIAPLIVLLFSLVVHKANWSLTARRIGLYVVVYAVLMTPWWMHNYQKYGSFVRLNLGDGSALVAGSICPAMDEGVQRHVRMQPECVDFGTYADPIVANDARRAAVLHYARRAPAEFAELMLRKAGAFWRPWVYTEGIGAQGIALVSYGSMLLATGVFLTLRWRDHRSRLAPIILTAAYMTVIHAIGYSYIRYRLPLEPFLIAIASFAFVTLASQRARTTVSQVSQTAS